eukprot:TRINITY_DN106482_c0_g1_i1.p1 TRINITY_DN106482_c0_g1~~TRINITY_DN106482_c0_g1_i1.p1  ORF type:complete len:945 (-),score=188.76 TRINITY_DN106482_c0_g1_i1:54-2864(-)
MVATGANSFNKPPNYYQLLGVASKANANDLKPSFRTLVTQWHPSKHPQDEEEAQEKLRVINHAFETLSNQVKRQIYDHMRAGTECRSMGVKLDTTHIKPHNVIPKEFLIAPLGCVDRFARVVGQNLVMQSREDDISKNFTEFYWNCKFSLWFSDQTSTCRLSCQQWTTQGVDLKRQGGHAKQLMYLNSLFEDGAKEDREKEAATTITASQDIARCNLNVTPSPFAAGAFRFESSHYPGRYLALRDDGPILMSAKDPDTSGDVMDFLLVDWSQAFKFMTITEVIKGAVENLGGAQGAFVKLKDVKSDHSLKLFFQQVMQCSLWSNGEFETFFEAHHKEWDFSSGRVRFRPGGPFDKHGRYDDGVALQATKSSEQTAAEAKKAPSAPVGPSAATVSTSHGELARKLRASRDPVEITKLVMAAAGDELTRLPVSAWSHALQHLGDASTEQALQLVSARRRFLMALPMMLGEGAGREKEKTKDGASRAGDIDIRTLLQMKKSVLAMKNADLESECEGALESIAGVAGARIRHMPSEVTLDALPGLISLPMSWRYVDEQLEDAVTALLKKHKPGAFLPTLKAAAGLRLAKQPLEILENLASWEIKNMNTSVASSAATVLLGVAESGIESELVFEKLRPPLLQRLAVGDLVQIVAAMAEHSDDEEALKAPLQGRVIVSGPALAAVPAAHMVRLAKAVSNSKVLSDLAIGPIAGAAANNLSAWPLEAIAELLLVVSTADGEAKPVSSSPGAKKLFARVDQEAAPRVRTETVDLAVMLKVVVGAAAAAGQCRGILEAAAMKAIVRVKEMKSEQLMLLTQGVLPLGKSHPVVVELLSHWTTSMADPATSLRVADDIAQLAMLVALVAPDQVTLFYVLGMRIQELAEFLSDTGLAALETAFPGGGGPNFPSKSEMMEALAARKAQKTSGEARDRSRSRSRSPRRRD